MVQMELCYVTNNSKNAMEMASIRLGYKISDYDKEGERHYPVYSGSRVKVEELGYGEIDDGLTLLGSEYIVTSMLQLYKNNEVGELEFELFCDVILREGNNDLFRRFGINFVCYNVELGEKIRSMILEVRDRFDEVVMQYAHDPVFNPILTEHYIDMVEGEGITWFLFDKIRDEYLDMTVYEMLFNGGYIWYNFSTLFSQTNSYIEEKFTFAYELITGNSHHEFNAYPGMRVTSKEKLDIISILPKLKRTMGEFSIINKYTLLDALRVKEYYRDYKTRIFKGDNSTYTILIHGYVDTDPQMNNEKLDEMIRSNTLKRLSVCKNDEDVVSLDKFVSLDLLELLHIVPHHENGFTFCFSDEYDLNTNPYTRTLLNKDNIRKHYHELFTK